MNFNFYHILKLTHWPLVMSVSLLCIISSLLMFFKYFIWEGVALGLVILFYSLLCWTQEVKVEGMLGYHNYWVKGFLKFSFMVFIFTEVMVFVSFFWAFFDSSLVPSVEGGMVWPPHHICPISPFSLPLLNTVLLLFSSVLLTSAHHGFYQGEGVEMKLWWTLIMGALFMMFQIIEYHSSGFNISSGIFGSTFFCLTGLHGTHVLVGGVFVFIFILCYRAGTYTVIHSVWLDLSSIYWHFVDVVWFFVWGFLYIWGA